MSQLLCPICRNPLVPTDRSLKCVNGHCFDYAKEGYVNLLTGSKAGEHIGDNRDMARSRRAFLDKGFFSVLSSALCDIVLAENPAQVLDICCGEGYYTQQLSLHTKAQLLGFDISKEMVRLAAKRGCKAEFFVANMADIPLESESVSCALHLFAPICAGEFARVIKHGGCLIDVTPGKKHLWQLKQVLYETPYENDGIPPVIEGFTLEKSLTASKTITVEGDDISALFRMTPYFYRTSPADRAKLEALRSLTTQTEFLIGIYRKEN